MIRDFLSVVIKITLKDLQPKVRIKPERSKTVLQSASNLLHLNHVMLDRLKNNIGQMKGKIKESITPEEFHLVERIHQNSYKKSFDLTKKTYGNLINL